MTDLEDNLEDNLEEYFTIWKKEGLTKEEQRRGLLIVIDRLLDEVYRVEEKSS